jgi:hypothetical protein
VRDRMLFAGGHVEEREFFCRFSAPDRVEVTGRHLPDGAQVSIEEAGYRIWPYRLLVPVGPVLLTVSCRDQHRVAPDGGLVDTVDARFLGIPAARTVIRVRPDDEQG